MYSCLLNAMFAISVVPKVVRGALGVRGIWPRGPQNNEYTSKMKQAYL